MAENSTYVSTMFATPEEFEAWCKSGNHNNKELLDKLCKEDISAWNGKATNLNINEAGELELLDCNRKCLCKTPICKADGTSIKRDSATGAITVYGVSETNGGKIVKIWYGTTAEYNKILVKDKANTIYICSDCLAGIPYDNARTVSEGTQNFPIGSILACASSTSCPVGLTIPTTRLGRLMEMCVVKYQSDSADRVLPTGAFPYLDDADRAYKYYDATNVQIDLVGGKWVCLGLTGKITDEAGNNFLSIWQKIAD